MAISPIELNGTIQRTQDMSVLKQNEDNKATLDQSNFQQRFDKEISEQFSKVRNTSETRNEEKKMDARDKGSNEYTGDGGKKRDKNNPLFEGKVVTKGEGGIFDVKI